MLQMSSIKGNSLVYLSITKNEVTTLMNDNYRYIGCSRQLFVFKMTCSDYSVQYSKMDRKPQKQKMRRSR